MKRFVLVCVPCSAVEEWKRETNKRLMRATSACVKTECTILLELVAPPNDQSYNWNASDAIIKFLINFFFWNIHILYIWEKLYKKWLKNTHTMILNRSSFHACIHNKNYCKIMKKKKSNECIYFLKSQFSHLKKKIRR